MKLLPALLLQDQPSGTALALMGTTMTLVMLLLAVVVIAGLWKVFTKAGHPGCPNAFATYQGPAGGSLRASAAVAGR